MGENYSFTVNGVMRSTSEDKPLLRYLREDLHLHSVKAVSYTHLDVYKRQVYDSIIAQKK